MERTFHRESFQNAYAYEKKLNNTASWDRSIDIPREIINTKCQQHYTLAQHDNAQQKSNCNGVALHGHTAQLNKKEQINGSFYKPHVDSLKQITSNLQSSVYRYNLIEKKSLLEKEYLTTGDTKYSELTKQSKSIEALLDGSIYRMLANIQKTDLNTAIKTFIELEKFWPWTNQSNTTLEEKKFIKFLGLDIMQIAHSSLICRKDYLNAHGILSHVKDFQSNIRSMQLEGNIQGLKNQRSQILLNYKKNHLRHTPETKAKLTIINLILSDPLTDILDIIKNAKADIAAEELSHFKMQLLWHFETHNLKNMNDAKADMINRHGIDLLETANKCFESRNDVHYYGDNYGRTASGTFTSSATIVGVAIGSQGGGNNSGNNNNNNKNKPDTNLPFNGNDQSSKKKNAHNAVSSEFKTMQMNGDKKELEIRKEQLEKALKNTWNPLKISSLHAQIAEINMLLESWITEALSIIKYADLNTAFHELNHLEDLARWEDLSYDPIFCVKQNKDSNSLSNIYHAAQKIFYARPDVTANIPAHCPTQLERNQKSNTNKPTQDTHLQKSTNNTTIANNQSITNDNKFVTTNQDTYAQHMVTQALNPTYNLHLVAQKLGDSVDQVYAHADKHNYFIPHEVDVQIQTSLNMLPNVQSSKEFAYNVATINHLLCDIQDQTAIQNNLPLNVIDRSPDLLTRALQEYWKDLAPTENEISLISDLACYISDVTIGTSYLAPEVIEQRVQAFWNDIDKLSFENLSQMTTEDWVDASAYVAARATWAIGITKTAAVLKNLKNVGTAASGAMTSFADKFIKIFDNIIGASPAVITAEGTVIANASPIVAAETAQAIYSLNGMQDTEGNKPKIIKDVDGVLDKQAQINEDDKKFLEKFQEPLSELTKNSEKIKEIRDMAFKESHTFSPEHKADGIMNLGKTSEEGFLKLIEIIKEADLKNMLNEGDNPIWFYSNGQPIELRVNIHNGLLRSINAFPGHSPKLAHKAIRI